MGRRILIGLLALGAIGGFAAGFAGLCRGAHYRHRHFEERVADVCTQAAERVYANRSKAKEPASER